ncbi:bacillithiol biosynthesis deacetylase BshB2 [Ornithinibacillus sp. 179-J 7C1 HS]|uniref:bacillithiol biosynthesis deacetylase BshB2 n=1 Tax=Ornithinibacillus sp. 179-J 7C1 HS TaxID=3142384 RepID=UPI0039A182C2
MEKHKHVVVIYPHPDDESFGAAGTIAEFREQGVPVTYLCGTLGEMGRNMGNPTFANRETLPEIRKKEITEASRVLDMELRLLGYRDKTLEYEDRNEVALHLKSILDEIEPTLVITHYPDHAVHPDHNALGAAAIEAVRLMNPEKRPIVWAQAITRTHIEDLGKPDVIKDVRDNFDKKMEAILCHQSQASGVIRSWNQSEDLSDDLKEQAKERLGFESFYIWKF